MIGRMWSLLQISVGREGHQISTLATWALMIELEDTKPSSFMEEIEKPVWVDAMVEEYESIVKN